MSSNDEEPAKKRRRTMQLPDGFEKRKPVDVPKPNVSVPKFTSAFGEKPQLADAKLLSKSKVVPTPVFVSKPRSKTSLNKPLSNTNLKQLAVPNFALPTKEKDDSITFIRIPIPPDPRLVAECENSPHLSLRPPPSPPPLPDLRPTKPGIPMKCLPLPTIFAPDEKSLNRTMRTISTTEIALATDLFSESGTAELAHIFLRDHHPEIAIPDKEPRLEWNIGLSPQKAAKTVKGKGKEARFVMGGMAARASDLMAQKLTSLALWQKETELQLASSYRLKPDLRLKIVKIIDIPAGAKSSSPRKPSPSASAGLSPGVALCCIIPSPGPHLPQLAHLLPKSRGKQHHLVVLSFPTVAPPRLKGRTGIYVRNPEDFIIGREIYVWEPWSEVLLSSRSATFDDTSSPSKNPEVSEFNVAPFPTLPPTYPRPSPLLDEGDIITADTVLLCSRFVIMP